MDKKILLLDIDFTMFNEMEPRPGFVSFIDWARVYFDKVLFYTAANHERITDVVRFMYHSLKITDTKFIDDIHRHSYHRQNMPMVDYRKEIGTYIEIKSLSLVAKDLGVKIENLVLVDDAPMYDHPNRERIIRVDGFYLDEESDFVLQDVKDQLISLFDKD